MLRAVWVLLLVSGLTGVAGFAAADEDGQQLDEELQITLMHPAVRPGLLHRFQVHLVPRQSEDHSQRRAAFVITVFSQDRENILFQRELQRVSARSLREGLVVNWLAPDEWPDVPLQVEVRWQLSGRPLTARKTLPDLLAIARRLTVLDEQLQAQGTQDPLPWLWIEQMAEELRGPTDHFGSRVIIDREALLRQWLTGSRDVKQLPEQAWRDPSDGSVQPVRLTRPEGQDPRGIVVALVNGPVHAKSRWPRMSEDRRTAITAAGWRVVEMFPAGDPAFQGHNRQRLQALIMAERNRYPDVPLVVFARGDSASGAVWQPLLHPSTVSAVIIDHGRWRTPATTAVAADEATQRWQELHQQPERRLAHLHGVRAYVSGPLDRHLRNFWQRRERVDGQSLLHQVDAQVFATSLWWEELARDLDPPQQPQEYRVLVPGRYGPWFVHYVADPLHGGSLRRERDSGQLAINGLEGVRMVTEGDRRQHTVVPSPTVVPPQASGYHYGRAQGPLSAYARQPFVVILGSGEHQAAAERNYALLNRFLSDWAQHAWGRPPVVSDQAFRSEDWLQHTWVLIGGPLSNAVTRRLQERAPQLLPVQWDHRSVSIEGRQEARSAQVGVAIAVAHPQDQSRQVIVLDGKPVWPEGDMPLRGLADFAWQIGDNPVQTRLLIPLQDEQER